MDSLRNSLSHNLWNASQSQALFALYHPFVVSLAAGTLQLPDFQRYIAQDEFFLTAFGQAYEMAKSSTTDQALRSQISELQSAVHTELKLHASLMEQGWSLKAAPIPATTAYTDFLHSVASGETYPELPSSKLAGFTLGAMTPCMRLYAFIGHQLQSAVANRDDHPYESWISTYSSPDFEKAAARIENLLDNISEEFLPADNTMVESLYHRAMSYELNFFGAHFSHGTSSSIVPLVQRVGSSGRKLIFVSDFDSTCTSSDSCPVLAELAFVKARPERRETWNRLSEGYLEKYSQMIESVLRPGKEGAYSYDHIREVLGVVSEFEKRGNAEVIDSRVLQGIKLEEVRDAAEKMPLETGCARVLRRLRASSDAVHILSVCWSQTFIQAALAKDGVEGVAIHSNELSSSSGGISDGGLIRRVETPLDKEEFLRKTILSGGDEEHFVVYVGDSLTDLLCLLQADVGIIVGSSSTLRRAAEAFGVEIVPLFKGLVDQACSGREKLWKKQEGTLYSASGWLELEALLLGEEA